tara:strand:- start:3208 stop:3435 length:228 start_codon:yes stop_codon:yes gene_type:complete
MKYGFTLGKEQIKALIEMLEKCRCEGEDQICVDLRTSVKEQYKSQYQREQESMTDKDILENASAMFGQSHCDDCD